LGWLLSLLEINAFAQVPKLLYEFPDYPANYGDFAPGPEVQRYIQKYAEDFNLITSISLNTEVQKITKRSDGKRGWTFIVKKDGKESTQDFDYAVV
jgi:dimethylaniline monooxygenase (N-oxide forming)